MATKRTDEPTPPNEPLPFDFVALQTQIVSASREAFDEVRRTYPNETICAFALYSDDGAETVCPAFDLASALAVRLEKWDGDRAYKFCPPEWKLEAFGGAFFSPICRTVSEFNRGLPDDDFLRFRSELFETCIRSLEQLRGEGLFGGPEMLVMFDASDYDFEPTESLHQMERLNGESPHVAEFHRWSKTWAK